MNKYIIDLKMPDVKNAGPKARNDVNFFLPAAGYKLVTLFYPAVYKRIITPLTLIPYAAIYLCKLFFLIQKNDIVLIQFPIPYIYVKIFNYIKKIKNYKLIFLIHDLENFRKGKSVEEDLINFKSADAIISHNPKMTELIKRPFITPNIIDLEVFDYKITTAESVFETASTNSAELIINYAGNLAPGKSGFAYDITSLGFEDNIKMIIFGINYKSELSNSAVIYGGAFSPDNPDILQGDFGLIWDGNSLETCEGLFGTYLRVNNPHKLSLYLAVSKPVIVWSEAAVAQFVIEKNVGIAVNNLAEIKQKLESLSVKERLVMKDNAIAYGKKVRQGYFIKTAVAKAEML